MAEEVPFRKEGIYIRDNVLYVIGPKFVAKVARVLSSETRTKILEVLSEGPSDLDNIAKTINQSKANVSSQIRMLESIGIVKATYVPGNRGIKKIIELRANKIVFYFRPPEA